MRLFGYLGETLINRGQRALSGARGEVKDNLCLHYNIISCSLLKTELEGGPYLRLAFIHFITGCVRLPPPREIVGLRMQ